MRVLSAALLSPTWRATGLCRRPVRRPILEGLRTRTARERIMDEGSFSVSAASLYNRIGTAAAPVLIDVRRRSAFDDDEWMIAGAIRRPPETVAEWSADTPKGQPVVVYCAHGQEVSRNVAASLRGIGVDARYLEGGIAERAAHRLPLRKTVPLGDRGWVTRARRKIDRSAFASLMRP